MGDAAHPKVPAHPVPDAVLTAHRRRLFAVLLVLSVLATLGAILALFAAPVVPVRILSVDAAPSPGLAGGDLTVTARIAGGSLLGGTAAYLVYAGYFSYNGGGSLPMYRTASETYTATVGPFPDGAVVWLFVVAGGESGQRVFSEDLVVDVGAVLRGGPSGLSVASVTLSPAQPASNDRPTVTATFGGYANVTGLYATFMFFPPASSAGGSCQSANGVAGERTLTVAYPFCLPPDAPEGYGMSAGTLWRYRLAVSDDSGNVALSDVHNFTVASP